MNYLLINTANQELIIEVVKGDLIFVSKDNVSKRHNEVLLPKLDELLKKAGVGLKDIDEFGVVIGPGSFTGIRVGIATVKAFKDVCKKPVRAINNLNLLYEIVKEKNLDAKCVAIEGSLNSYFVGKIENDKLNIYERNLTLDELADVSEKSVVAFYTNQNNYPNAKIVEFDEKAFLKAFLNSTSKDLTPVYYQLSQAENDKINRAEVCVKEAEVWDIKAICELDKANFDNHWDDDTFQQVFLSKSNTVFVASLQDSLVGFVVIENDIDEINISHIVVDKEYRNHGIGSKLVKFVEAYSKTKKIDTVSLEVSVNNFTAKTLYEKLGYKVRRIRKEYYKDKSDAVEMFKKLD